MLVILSVHAFRSVDKWEAINNLQLRDVVTHVNMCEGSITESATCLWLMASRSLLLVCMCRPMYIYLCVCEYRCEPVIDCTSVYTLTVKPASVLWLTGWLIAACKTRTIISSISESVIVMRCTQGGHVRLHDRVWCHYIIRMRNNVRWGLSVYWDKIHLKYVLAMT